MARPQGLPLPQRLHRMLAQRTNTCKTVCRQDGSSGSSGNSPVPADSERHESLTKLRDSESSVKSKVNNPLMTHPSGRRLFKAYDSLPGRTRVANSQSH